MRSEAERREYLEIALPCLEAFEYTVNVTSTTVSPRNRAPHLPMMLHASELAHQQANNMMIRGLVPKGCLRLDKQSRKKRLGVGCIAIRRRKAWKTPRDAG